MKKKFKVIVREVWICSYLIEANSKEEAIELAHIDITTDNKHLIEGSEEYSHTLPKTEWTAEEMKKEEN